MNTIDGLTRVPEDDPAQALDTEDGRPRTMPVPGEQIDLSTDERKSLGEHIVKLWEKCRHQDGDRADWRQTISGDWDEYNLGMDMRPTNFPLEAPDGTPLTSNFTVPVLHTSVNALMAQWMQPIYDQDPLFTPEQSVEDKRQRTLDDCQRYVRHLCRNVMHYERSHRSALERVGVEGQGIKRWYWDKRERRRFNRDARKMETTTIYDAPACEVVPWDRFAMYPATETDPDKAAYVFLRYDLPLAEIKHGRKPGADGFTEYVMDDETWKRIEDGAKPGETKPENQYLDGQALGRSVPALLVYGTYDAGDDLVDVVFTVLPDEGLVISAVVSPLGSLRPVSLHYAYDHGDNPKGKSVADILRGINGGIHAFLNQAADDCKVAQLMALTFWADPDDCDDFRVGTINPMRTPNGVGQMRYSVTPMSMEVLRLFEDQAQHATGLNDNVLGAFAPASTTATQTRATMGAGSVQFEESIQLLAEGQERDAEIINELIRVHAPEQIEFTTEATDAETDQHQKQQREAAQNVGQVLGQETGVDPSQLMPDVTPAPRLVARKLKASDFDGVCWNVAGTTPGMDKTTRSQETATAMQLLLPMVQQHPDQVWEFANKLLSDLGWDHISRFIGEKPDPDEDNSAMAAAVQAQQQTQAGPRVSVNVPGSPLPLDITEQLMGLQPQQAQPAQPVAPNGNGNGVDPATMQALTGGTS